MKAAAFRKVIAVAAVLLAGPAAPAQGPVRLMPQLGIGVVTSIAVSPDGRFAVSGSNTEAAVRLWDLESGYQIRVLQMHDTARINDPPSTVFAGSLHHAISLSPVPRTVFPAERM